MSMTGPLVVLLPDQFKKLLLLKLLPNSQVGVRVRQPRCNFSGITAAYANGARAKQHALVLLVVQRILNEAFFECGRRVLLKQTAVIAVAFVAVGYWLEHEHEDHTRIRKLRGCCVPARARVHVQRACWLIRGTTPASCNCGVCFCMYL